MTRKHFELIAATIRELDASMRAKVACEFARALQSTNPAFNVERFMRACGVK